MAHRIKARSGDVFLVPRKDGKWVLGQLLEEWAKGVICIAIFDCVIDGKTDSISALKLGAKVISITSVSTSEITRKHWPLVGYSDVLIDAELFPHREFAHQKYNGAVWHSGGMIEKLVDAYYGLGSWEPYSGRPGHLKSLLLNK